MQAGSHPPREHVAKALSIRVLHTGVEGQGSLVRAPRRQPVQGGQDCKAGPSPWKEEQEAWPRLGSSWGRFRRWPPIAQSSIPAWSPEWAPPRPVGRQWELFPSPGTSVLPDAVVNLLEPVTPCQGSGAEGRLGRAPLCLRPALLRCVSQRCRISTRGSRGGDTARPPALRTAD